MIQKFLLSSTFIFISLFIYAQDSITISGKILDNNKQPLPGATVLVKGTAIGTLTDNDGKYSLTVPKDAKTLVVGYIGFDNKEMPINAGQGSYQLNIQMASSNIELNQVVVSVSKRQEKLLDAPASISIVGQAEIDRNVVTTLADELETTAGVDVMKTGLISRNVVVRGFNDIFSGTVLNVVDDRIGAVPSLQFNAFQLIPVSDLDVDKMEVVRGPASALYGPNAASGVISIITKSPLDQDKQFETTVSMNSGFTVLAKSYQQYNNGHPLSGNIVNPEIRTSGKFLDGKIGYKVSASYFEGQDYPNYDPREPYQGDSLIFGSVHNGNVFTPDTLGTTITRNPSTGKMDTTANLDIREFNKNFFIRKYTADARLDFKPVKDVLITINGGLSSSHNIELTGLGAGVAGGDNGGWIYWYIQTKIKWKKLFIQYFTNASNSGNTYLIPQISASERGSTPYQVQLLEDKSMLHVVQVQHSWNPIEKLNFIYGVDGMFTRPNTEGTIDGRFEAIDNLNQVGGYIQGTYDPLKWLTFVAAMRVDYNSAVSNAAISPRAALVFKVAENQSIRLTYNRAFDPPTTLDQFLDLADEQLPNGMDARGIGNPYGYNYNYTNGNIDYITAPWTGPQSNTQWIAFNSTAGNVASFDSIKQFMVRTLASTSALAAIGGNPTANANVFINELFAGIAGPTGTVANATLNAVNLNNFGSTNNYAASLISNPNIFQNLKKINNSYTSTVELGYKGLLFHKLSVQVDAYWNRITNYVSALTPASAGVTFNKSFLGPDNSSGLLYQNLANGALNGILSALRDQPSLINPTVVPVSPSSSPASDWSEIVTLISTLPIGSITPNSPYVNSDYILTFENQGTINTYGGDIGLQYQVFETDRHNISMGGSFSYVDKDHYVVAPGDTAWLNAPKIKASLTFDHILNRSGFGYGLTFRYQQAYYGESSVYLGQVKSAYLPDARIYYKPKFYKGLLLSLNVNDFINYQWASFPGTAMMGYPGLRKGAGYFLNVVR